MQKEKEGIDASLKDIKKQEEKAKEAPVAAAGKEATGAAGKDGNKEQIREAYREALAGMGLGGGNKLPEIPPRKEVPKMQAAKKENEELQEKPKEKEEKPRKEEVETIAAKKSDIKPAAAAGKDAAPPAKEKESVGSKLTGAKEPTPPEGAVGGKVHHHHQPAMDLYEGSVW